MQEHEGLAENAEVIEDVEAKRHASTSHFVHARTVAQEHEGLAENAEVIEDVEAKRHASTSHFVHARTVVQEHEGLAENAEVIEDVEAKRHASTSHFVCWVVIVLPAQPAYLRLLACQTCNTTALHATCNYKLPPDIFRSAVIFHFLSRCPARRSRECH